MRRVLERLMSIGAAPVSAVDAGHGARSPSGRKAYHPGNCARGAERIAGPVAAGAGRRARRTLAQVRNQLLAWHLEPPPLSRCDSRRASAAWRSTSSASPAWISTCCSHGGNASVSRALAQEPYLVR